MSAATGLQEYCVCHGSDDGRPMIHCENCDDWLVNHSLLSYVSLTSFRFHFACINLDEDTAAEIGMSPL